MIMILMVSSKLIAGIFLLAIGLIFLFNNKKISKGTYKFYQFLYTEKNLVIMFKIAGVILLIGGLILIFIKS